jgi:thiol:disulfide interchange protein
MKELFEYSILALVAGVLLNFVPCVLPVIPLKVRAVLREIKGDIRSRILAAACLLCGSLVFFLTLGGATAYLGLTWGALFQSKAFIAALSALLFFAAMATFADWSPRLPNFIYQVPIQRYTGAFLTGALAGILSTPCSGPFLGSVLAYALTQRPLVILVIFSSIGIGLAGPYVLILVWPGLMDRLSFSGPWTVSVKQILGFILLAGAIFFGRVLMPATWQPFLWWMLSAAVIIWAIIVFWRSKEWGTKLFPLAAIVVVLLVLVVTLPENHLKWQEYSSESMQHTLSEHRPVLLEFTAEWCLNCKILDKTSYADKKVVQIAGKVKLAPYRVDMTDFDEDYQALLEKFGGTALPYALLMDQNGNVTRRFAGMFTGKTLAGAIERLTIN